MEPAASPRRNARHHLLSRTTARISGASATHASSEYSKPGNERTSRSAEIMDSARLLMRGPCAPSKVRTFTTPMFVATARFSSWSRRRVYHSVIGDLARAVQQSSRPGEGISAARSGTRCRSLFGEQLCERKAFGLEIGDARFSALAIGEGTNFDENVLTD